jgi:hypothetical protein
MSHSLIHTPSHTLYILLVATPTPHPHQSTRKPLLLGRRSCWAGGPAGQAALPDGRGEGQKAPRPGTCRADLTPQNTTTPHPFPPGRAPCAADRPCPPLPTTQDKPREDFVGHFVGHPCRTHPHSATPQLHPHPECQHVGSRSWAGGPVVCSRGRKKSPASRPHPPKHHHGNCKPAVGFPA